MRQIIILFTTAIFGFISINTYSQILVKNTYQGKQFEIQKNDHIKLVIESEKKFNGFYDFVVHGKNKDFKTGKLKSYCDNYIIIQSGLFGKQDTILVKNIQTINKYNPYVRAGVVILTSAGVVLFLTSNAIVNSPFIVAYALVGIWGISLTDDLVIYPHKNIKEDNWIVEFK